MNAPIALGSADAARLPLMLTELRMPTAKRLWADLAEQSNREGWPADLSSAKGTAWGLVNAVTEYADHSKRARSNDHRLDSAWFGPGAQLKQAAWTEALKLVS